MTKINIEDIQEALKIANVTPDQQDKVIEHLQQVAAEEKKEKEENKLPRQKTEFGVILIDELGEIKTDNVSALIYQIPDDVEHDSVLERVQKSIQEHNQTKKGIKTPVKSVTEAFNAVKPKTFKNHGLTRKTKEIVRCIKSNNKI